MTFIRIISLSLFVVASSMSFAHIEPKININNNMKTKIFHKSTPRLADNIRNKSSPFYPTQVIRLKGNLEAYNLSCDDFLTGFHDNFDVFFNIKDTDFYAYGVAGCGSDDSDSAQNFRLWVQLEAWSNDAINKLQNLIEQKKGTDFYGQTIDVEEVQGVVASVDLVIGNFIPPQDRTIHVDYHLNYKLYFNSFIDMKFEFLNKVVPNFLSNDIELVKSFLSKWIIEDDDIDRYSNTIINSNYIELQTEMVFLFKKEPRVEQLPFSYPYICSRTRKGVCRVIPHVPEGLTINEAAP